jgi:hypothetical protein
MAELEGATFIESRAGLSIKHWRVSSIKRAAAALECGRKMPNTAVNRTLRDKAAQRRLLPRWASDLV